MGLFADIMNAIGKILGAIGRGIATVMRAVAAVVNWFGTKVLPIIALLFSGGVLIIATIAIFAPAAAGIIVSVIIKGMKDMFFTIDYLFGVGPTGTRLAIETLKTVIATFLEMIHFDTILKLHQIAWVLSEDYRNTLRELFKGMSEYSEHVFEWTLGMRIILENSRSIFLNSAQALGYSYDLAQLGWLNTMTDVLVKVNNKSGVYADDPEQFFFDLEEWVDQHAIDISGGSHGVIFQVVEKQTDALHANTVLITDIDQKTRQNNRAISLITGRDYDGQIARTNRVIDGFQKDEYAPTKKRQDESIELNRQQTAQNRQETARLAKKMTTPTGQVSEIDDLQEPDKTEQEESLEDLSTRPYQEDNETLETEKQTVSEEHNRELEESEAADEESLQEEPVTKEPVEPKKIKRRPPVNSWFVGDY